MKVTAALACCALSGLLASPSSAQNKTYKLQLPPANIKIDGDLKDWGDSLRYYNEDKKLFYSLANDQENIYVAMRFNDRTEEMRILHAGLTLSINPKGKKKDEYSITFPVGGDTGDGPGMWGQRPPDSEKPTQEDRDELLRARLTKLRNIKVAGFSDIESDIITTSNTYGIKVALNYDKDGYLVYEAAVPVKFFHTEINDKKEWAFNFKINGITRPSGSNHEGGGEGMRGGGMGRGGMGGGMGGMGGGGMRGGGGRGGMRGGGMRGGSQGGDGSTDRSELSKSMDFWEKFYMNK